MRQPVSRGQMAVFFCVAVGSAAVAIADLSIVFRSYAEKSMLEFWVFLASTIFFTFAAIFWMLSAFGWFVRVPPRKAKRGVP